MRIYDLIEKKRDGGELTTEEIDFFIKGVTDSSIPTYQVSAMLMAIYFRGMTDRETSDMTLAMAHSGDVMDLSVIKGHTVDKHSTGGVGDKTTLIVAPIVAACGGIVAKMSGRGLGHTGGTVDKLESIPGFKTEMSVQDFLSCAQENGLCVIGQSGNLTPADKKLYALRDVTATVDSIPLIASSIMSKKLAAGNKSIVLDVKVGSGAFIKDVDRARLLARKMINIGNAAGRNVRAVLTNMDVPLGHAVGNALEVKEAVEVLNGRGPEDLKKVCIALASNMISLVNGIDAEKAEDMCLLAISSGAALERLRKMVIGQGGDVSYIDSPEKFKTSLYSENILSPRGGYIARMNTESIGISSVILGAGREKKEDSVDFAAGIIIKKKTGDEVRKGDVLAVMYTDKKEALPVAEERYLQALIFSDEKPEDEILIYGTEQ